MYRLLRAIRSFERATAALKDTDDVPGSVHRCLGQEAVAVGACLPLEDDDIIGSSHRGHGHVLAKGAKIDRMMAEIAGKESGLNDGRGGSMHMADFSLGIFGCNGIVGASVPHVLGGVLSADLDDEDRVGIAFFGDGAANQGVVHETMNLATIWDLPVIFLCENNQYAVSTPSDRAVAGARIADRAAGYGIPGERINGQNVLSVFESVRDTVESVRQDRTPALIECETYRYDGHFHGEATLLADRQYRKAAELETWQSKKDPLKTFRDALLTTETFEERTLSRIDAEVESTVDAAKTFARESDLPSGSRALDNTYTNQGYPDFPAVGYR